MEAEVPPKTKVCPTNVEYLESSVSDLMPADRWNPNQTGECHVSD
jgi:hypothetical protein